MPYAIEKIDNGEIVRRFGSLPKSLEVTVNGRNRRVIAPVAVGDEGLGHRMIEIVEVDFAPPGQFYHQGDLVVTRQGNVRTETRHWEPWTQAEIDAYEASRLDGIADQIAQVDNPVRAALLVVLDDFNRHSAVHRAILAAAAAATSLADFKSRMGQINGVPTRTAYDLLDAVRAKLGAST